MYPKEKRPYYPGIDLLRFLVAIAIAFIYHYVALFNAKPYGDKQIMSYLYSSAGYGVELFFAISGFVMYQNYSNRIRESSIDFFSFIKGRIIRIYPVMIITTIVAALGQWMSLLLYQHEVAIPVLAGVRNSLVAFVLNILGLQCGWVSNHDSLSVNGPTWFISIIMICYIIFFIILRSCKMRNEIENVCFFCVIILGIFLYTNPLNIPLLYYSCGRGYLNFFAGVMLAKFQYQIKSRKKKNLLVLLSLISLALFYWLRRIGFLGDEGLAYALVWSPAVLFLVINLKSLNFIAGNSVGRYLGKIAFSIYLWNIPVAIWIQFFNEKFKMQIDFWNPTFYGSFIALSILVSVLSYHLFEKPTAKFLKKYY